MRFAHPQLGQQPQEIRVPSDNHFSFTDSDGSAVEVSVHSTGQTAIEIHPTSGPTRSVLLTPIAARDLRDMLNRRFRP